MCCFSFMFQCVSDASLSYFIFILTLFRISELGIMSIVKLTRHLIPSFQNSNIGRWLLNGIQLHSLAGVFYFGSLQSWKRINSQGLVLRLLYTLKYNITHYVTWATLNKNTKANTLATVIQLIQNWVETHIF